MIATRFNLETMKQVQMTFGIDRRNPSDKVEKVLSEWQTMVNASHRIHRGHQQTLLHTRQFNSIRFDSIGRRKQIDVFSHWFITISVWPVHIYSTLDQSNNKVDSDEHTIDVDGHHTTVSNATSLLLITIEKRRVTVNQIDSLPETSVSTIWTTSVEFSDQNLWRWFQPSTGRKIKFFIHVDPDGFLSFTSLFRIAQSDDFPNRWHWSNIRQRDGTRSTSIHIVAETNVFFSFSSDWQISPWPKEFIRHWHVPIRPIILRRFDIDRTRKRKTWRGIGQERRSSIIVSKEKERRSLFWRLTQICRVSRRKFSFRSLDWEGLSREGHDHAESSIWRKNVMSIATQSDPVRVLDEVVVLSMHFSPLSWPDGRWSKREEEIRLVWSIEHSNHCSSRKEKSVCNGTWEVCCVQPTILDETIEFRLRSSKQENPPETFHLEFLQTTSNPGKDFSAPIQIPIEERERRKVQNVQSSLSLSADQTRQKKIQSFGSSSSRIAQINRVGEKFLPNERCERRRDESSRGNRLKIPFVPRCHWLQIPSFVCHSIILIYSFESLLIQIEMSLSSSSFWNFECSSSRKCNEKKKEGFTRPLFSSLHLVLLAHRLNETDLTVNSISMIFWFDLLLIVQYRSSGRFAVLLPFL